MSEGLLYDFVGWLNFCFYRSFLHRKILWLCCMIWHKNKYVKIIHWSPFLVGNVIQSYTTCLMCMEPWFDPQPHNKLKHFPYFFPYDFKSITETFTWRLKGLCLLCIMKSFLWLELELFSVKWDFPLCEPLWVVTSLLL